MMDLAANRNVVTNDVDGETTPPAAASGSGPGVEDTTPAPEAPQSEINSAPQLADSTPHPPTQRPNPLSEYRHNSDDIAESPWARKTVLSFGKQFYAASNDLLT
jgi:hypothetical protein